METAVSARYNRLDRPVGSGVGCAGTAGTTGTATRSRRPAVPTALPGEVETALTAVANAATKPARRATFAVEWF
jgi:hypothetical protein